MSGSESDRLIQELRQHQFELQEQNNELRRTYDELDRVTARYRSLWESAPIGYVTLEPNGVIVTANRPARAILSAIRPVTAMSTLASFLDADSRVILRQHLWSVSVSRAPVPVELRLETAPNKPDGWVQVESTVTGDGEYRTAIIDISARRVAEARHEVLASQLRQTQKMEALHELSAGIVHDFNNLLQVIIASGQMVRDQVTKAGLSEHHISNLMHGASSAASLTRRLLAFSRKTPLHAEAVDLRDIIADTIGIARRTVPENIEITCLSVDEPVVCQMDANLIEQGLLNLYLNARDAMPDGGELTVRLATRTLQRETVIGDCWLPTGDYAVVEVQDTGIGMDQETVMHVFEPFFTTKSTKGDERGTGLGLAVVYGIIRQHLGAIDIQSEPGVGTRFTVYMPLSQHAQPKTPGPVARPTGQRRVTGARLLLVEDRDPVRLVIAWMLRDAGYTVVEASDGGEAVSIIEEDNKIDLLLTDAIMPVHNGQVVCKKFHEKHPKSPAVFLTGHGDGVLDPDFVQEHELAVLGKPIQRDRLLGVIGEKLEHLNKNSAPDEPE